MVAHAFVVSKSAFKFVEPLLKFVADIVVALKVVAVIPCNDVFPVTVSVEFIKVAPVVVREAIDVAPVTSNVLLIMVAPVTFSVLLIIVAPLVVKVEIVSADTLTVGND